MSKAHDPHWRYVAFRIEGGRVGRAAFQNALKGRARHKEVHVPQLTRYAWPHGIVKCHHTDLAATRTLLSGITWAIEGEAKVPLAVETLLSSGTIKTLTDRLGILQERGKDHKKPDRERASSERSKRRPGTLHQRRRDPDS